MSIIPVSKMKLIQEPGMILLVFLLCYACIYISWQHDGNKCSLEITCASNSLKWLWKVHLFHKGWFFHGIRDEKKNLRIGFGIK